jgi:monoterpene epsilon-lactone hydrolase
MRSIRSRIWYHLIRRKLAQQRALNLPLAQLRAQADRNGARMFKVPTGVSTEATEVAGLAAEWLRPEGARTDGLLLYLHGGAYVQGSVRTHRALAARLALSSQTSACIVDYRLAPEHPYPAAVDDAVRAYAALQQAHPGRPIALAGDSAGGGLAVATALRLRDEGLAAPAALALLSPWTDLTLGNPTHRSKASVDPFFPDSQALSLAARAYAGANDLKTPLISPQFADLGGLPPTLIHVGELEALLDDSRLLAAGLQGRGTPAELKIYPSMWHVWQAFGGRFREADQSIEEMGRFLRSRLEP